ncbi:MAG: sigma-70 family RNA polymerase sigma factor [Bacteroidota bacterium]
MDLNQEKNVCEHSVYENLYRSLVPTLHRFLLYKFPFREHVDDTIQEAFFILWKNCKKVTPELAKTYVYKVSQNLIIRKISKDKSHKRYLGFQSKSNVMESPEFYMEYKEMREKLKNAIADLPDGQREVFLMNRFDKKTYSEIANELGLSVKAVEKRMHNALIKLRIVCKNI